MTPGYKYVTSRRALEAALVPLFSAGHLVHPKGLAPADAAHETVRLVSIHLSGQPDSTPLRDAEQKPVVDDDEFFS